jgi:hypothetical protein
MPSLTALRDRAAAALHRNADVLYPRTLTFKVRDSDPQGRTCRCKVKDPDKVGQRAVQVAQAIAADVGVPYTDLRLLSVHPDDKRPAAGMSTAFDGGRLEVLSWSQESDITRQKVATCVLRR